MRNCRDAGAGGLNKAVGGRACQQLEIVLGPQPCQHRRRRPPNNYVVILVSTVAVSVAMATGQGITWLRRQCSPAGSQTEAALLAARHLRSFYTSFRLQCTVHCMAANDQPLYADVGLPLDIVY